MLFYCLLFALSMDLHLRVASALINLKYRPQLVKQDLSYMKEEVRRKSQTMYLGKSIFNEVLKSVYHNPLSSNLTIWSNTMPTNCLSVLDHFMGLAPKGLIQQGKCSVDSPTDIWIIIKTADLGSVDTKIYERRRYQDGIKFLENVC